MVNISESKLSNEFAANILNTLSASKNKAAKRYSRSVLDLQLSDLSQAIREIQNGEPSESLINLAHEIHTSFLESLKVVAARIPAQSMQSFMPMRVVAFEGEDVNTAFVSTAQILFQGSDYDIDAVSLASFAFGRDGRYAIHSPYANLEDSELLEASKKLPFPTGESL
jgi:hypothetical protein